MDITAQSGSIRAALWGTEGFIQDCCGGEASSVLAARYAAVAQVSSGDFRLIRRTTRQHDAAGLRYCPAELRWTSGPTDAASATANSTTAQSSEDHLHRETQSGHEWEITLKNVDLARSPLTDLDAFLDHYHVDRRIWTVAEWRCGLYEQGAKNNDGELISQRLGNIRARIVRTKEKESAQREIESLRAELKLAVPVPPVLIRSRVQDPKHCLELSLPDAHFGKLAWGEETGWGDYDTGIAAQRYRAAIATLLHRTDHYNLARIILVLGNDMFNSDNKQNLTTRGTPQDTDTRYQKSFLVVRRLVTEAILTLRQRCPVDVVLVPGNHDQLTTWHLGDSLECAFAHDPEVTIDNSPPLRKYYRWGTSQILWTHGDKESWRTLPLLMARERAADWAACRFHEVHTGHRHDTWAREEMGVRVRRLPSLTGTDAYHSDHGYVGNIAAAEGYVWHLDDGLVDIPVYCVPE